MNKMKRRRLIIVITMILLVTLIVVRWDIVDQSKSIKREDPGSKIKVITTIFPQYDFTRQLGGNFIDLRMLIAPGTETHSYEPSPQDIIDIENSDLFIYVGGENDVWVERMLEGMENPPRTLKMMDSVELYKEEVVEGMDNDHDHDHDHEEDMDIHLEGFDEHIWTSVKNAILISQDISEVLIQIDPDNKEDYIDNRDSYVKKLEELDAEYRKTVKLGNDRPIVFADRFPFRYMFEEYGLDYYAAFPGCSAESEASAGTIKFLIDKVIEEDIGVVYFIEFSNEKMADIISEETGANKLLMHSGHNLSKEDFDENLGYIDIMTDNLYNLKEALR